MVVAVLIAIRGVSRAEWLSIRGGALIRPMGVTQHTLDGKIQ